MKKMKTGNTVKKMKTIEDIRLGRFGKTQTKRRGRERVDSVEEGEGHDEDADGDDDKSDNDDDDDDEEEELAWANSESGASEWNPHPLSSGALPALWIQWTVGLCGMERSPRTRET